MAPMIALAAALLVVRLFAGWRDATRIALAVMFLFTGFTHFTALKHEMAAMIPPPFSGNLSLIYITGVLEIAGAVGLLIPRFRRLAAVCLILLLVALFPANVYAALANVPFQGRPATPLWIRTPMQVLWMVLLWWSSVRTPQRPASNDRSGPVSSSTRGSGPPLSPG